MLPHTCYLVCTTHRTGSVLLCEALRDTQLAGAPDEYLWNGGRYTYAARWDAAAPDDYLAHLFARTTSANGVFGAKLMGDHLSEVATWLRGRPGLAGLSPAGLWPAAFPNVHYVWLTRRDKVRQAVSIHRAVQTQQWVQTAGDAPPPAERPTYDFAAIDWWRRHIAAQEAEWRCFFERAGVAPLSLAYEEFIMAYEATAAAVLDYLGVPAPQPLALPAPRPRRQADALSEQWVQQFRREAAQQAIGDL